MFPISRQAALLCAIALAGTVALAQAPTTPTFPNLDDAAGWKSCTKPCAGGNGTAVYSMTQGVTSPSEDGSSAQFHLGGSTGYSNALWWLHVGSSASATNFLFDLDQYLDNPAAAQAIEYATTYYYKGGWYKYSIQCSFAKGIWRVWDSANKAWVATTVPCTRPAADTWTHLSFQTQRANGKAVFVSITINGQTYYVNKAFLPNTSSSGTNGDITVHYQLDGNKTQTSYNAWIDDMSLTIW